MGGLDGNGEKRKRKSKKNDKPEDEELELIQIREANLLLKKEYQKVSGMSSFDEKKLVDTSILALLGNSKNNI